jgi:outer membrane lipoprotein-sorting protein
MSLSRGIAVAFAGALLLAGMTFPAFAQDDDALARIAARVEQPELLRGTFEQARQVQGFRQPLRSSGRFVLSREHGVLWLTEKPFPSSLSVTSRGLVAENGGQVRRIDTEKEPGLRAVNSLLADLLGGELARLEQDFSIRIEHEDADGWKLALTPKGEPLNRVFNAIGLQGAAYVESVSLDESNGDATRITFSQLAQEPALSDAEAQRLAQ